MKFKRLGLSVMVIVLTAFFALPKSSSALLSVEEVYRQYIHNLSGKVLGTQAYGTQVVTSKGYTAVIISATPLHFNDTGWSYEFDIARKLNRAGSFMVNNVLVLANASQNASVTVDNLAPGSRAKITYYSQPNGQGAILVNKYLTVMAAAAQDNVNQNREPNTNTGSNSDNSATPSPIPYTPLTSNCTNDADCTGGNVCTVVGWTNSTPSTPHQSCTTPLDSKPVPSLMCPKRPYPYCPYGYISSTNSAGCTIVTCDLIPIPPAILGDITGDGRIDCADYQSLKNLYMTNSDATSVTDLDKDGLPEKVDLGDLGGLLVILRNNGITNCDAPILPPAVPTITITSPVPPVVWNLNSSISIAWKLSTPVSDVYTMAFGLQDATTGKVINITATPANNNQVTFTLFSSLATSFISGSQYIKLDLYDGQGHIVASVKSDAPITVSTGPVLGDITGDGRIDCADYQSLKNLYMTNSDATSVTDLDKDGLPEKVDLGDLGGLLVILRNNGITNCDAPILPPTVPAITITSPTPPVTWALGSPVSVAWKFSSPVSDVYYMAFGLKDAASDKVTPLTRGPANSNQITFTLPTWASMILGSQYIQLDLFDGQGHAVASVTSSAPVTVTAGNTPAPTPTPTPAPTSPNVCYRNTDCASGQLCFGVTPNSPGACY